MQPLSGTGKHEYPCGRAEGTGKGGVHVVTAIIDKNGIPGMPTFNIRKVRKLLKGKRAVIAGHRPFTVRLLYADFSGPAAKQDIEICQDTGI